MGEPAIAIKHLTKDFRIGVRGVKLRAVDDVSLEIRDNEIFGLLGPNGCGKSTTMKIVLGLLEPTRGTCSIYGVDSHAVKSRRNVGFLPEAPYFYKFLSGRELVRFYARICGVPRDEIDDRTEETLKLVSMETAAHRRVGVYSKGMLQRIGIAQAIVHDPKLIVLDEPTAGVDPVGSHAIAELIMALKQRGKTIMLCSHLLAQVEGVCDRVAIMSRGKLVLEGGVDELLEKEDQRNLIVRDYKPACREEIEAVLAKHGAKLEAVSAPRISLDRLFLQHTDSASIGSGQDVRDGKEDA